MQDHNVLSLINQESSKIIDNEFFESYVRLFFAKRKTTNVLILLRKYVEFYTKVKHIEKTNHISLTELDKKKNEIIKNLAEIYREHNNDITSKEINELLTDLVVKLKVNSVNLNLFMAPYLDTVIDESDVIQFQNLINTYDRTLELIVVHNNLKKFIENDVKNISSIEEYTKKIYQLSRTTVNTINRYIVSKKDDKPVRVSTTSPDFVERVSNAFKSLSPEESVSTGYEKLDTFLKGGFQKQRVYLLIGLPGSGKSTIILNFGINAWKELAKKKSKKKKVIYYITLENSMEETLVRFASAITNDPHIKDHPNKLSEVLNKNKDVEFILEYYRPRTIGPLEILNFIKEIESDNKEVEMVIIDYLGKLGYVSSFGVDKLPEWERLGLAVDDLKYAAISSNTVVVTAHQFNRGAKDRGRSAGHENIGGSWEIVKNGDVLIYSYRNFDDEEVRKSALALQPVELIIKKNRFGPDNVGVDLMINFNTWKVSNMTANAIGDLEEAKKGHKLF